MYIQNSNLNLSSARTYSQTSTQAISVSTTSALFSRSQDGTVTNLGSNAMDALSSGKKFSFREQLDSFAMSEDEEPILGQNYSPNDVSRTGLSCRSEFTDLLEEIRRRCIEFLMMIFYGCKNSDGLQEKNACETKENAGQTLEGVDAPAPSRIGDQVFQVITTVRQTQVTVEESENTSFSAMGNVVTADGRKIPIQLQVGMSRSMSEKFTMEEIRQSANLVDPLTIQLDGTVGNIGAQSFFFDLDADGEAEEIAAPTVGAAFLALDRNGDGTINDGSELFGTKSGDGFEDLAAFDEDGNGWIDEADEVFHKLVVWAKDENGNDIQYRLKEVGVGALALSRVNTEFSLYNQDLVGKVRSTGLFLYENGNVGTLQQIDLTAKSGTPV